MLCLGNFRYSIDSYKIFLHTHCFGYPDFDFPLKSMKLPNYTISFSWNKRLLEPKFLCDEYVPLTISSPPLHSLLTRRKRKLSFKKVKLVYLKSLQSIILLDFLERTVRKLKSFEWEKRPKAEGKMSPKILLEKNKERENRVSEEKERKRKKKSNGCTASFLFFFCLRALFWL